MRRTLMILPVLVLAAGSLAACGDSSDDEPRALPVGTLLEQTDDHGHPLRELPAEDAPTVDLEVHQDAKSGWNLHLRTTNFRFAPEHASEDAVGGEGHAHLFVDDMKIGRVYGEWVHLDQADVPRGIRTITVTLNGNDHSTLVVDGEPVSDSVEIASEGPSGSGHTHTHADGEQHEH